MSHHKKPPRRKRDTKKVYEKKSEKWKEINKSKGLTVPKFGFNLFESSCGVGGCRIEVNTPKRREKGKDPIFTVYKGKKNRETFSNIKKSREYKEYINTIASGSGRRGFKKDLKKKVFEGGYFKDVIKKGIPEENINIDSKHKSDSKRDSMDNFYNDDKYANDYMGWS